jgi:hypothetical protein
MQTLNLAIDFGHVVISDIFVSVRYFLVQNPLDFGLVAPELLVISRIESKGIQARP